MSEPKEELKSKDVNPNGKPPAETRTVMPVRQSKFGRVLEVLAVASLAGCVFVGLETNGVVAFLTAAGLLFSSLLMYRGAKRCAVRASLAELEREAAEKSREAAQKYKVTSARLNILRHVGVPEDVRDALAFLLEEKPLPADALLRRLALDHRIDLGWGRTNEFRETILKYTKYDRNDDPPPPPPPPPSGLMSAQPPSSHSIEAQPAPV